jgi:hypothetical protein
VDLSVPGISELIIPVHKSRRAYAQLSKCHTSLTSIYEAIVEQESSPIPFTDATYYRVGFYGKSFGSLNCKEYVYREPRDVRLGDIMRNLGNIYEPRVIQGKQNLHIIPDSRQVNLEELQAGICYLQITSVDPVTEDEDLESRRERQLSGRSSSTISAQVCDRFLFDTPFTKNGRSQGGLEDQWKRRTVLWTEGPFPALVNRLMVVKSESREFSPIENAIGMIETRTAALAGELDDQRIHEGDAPPRLQGLQRILQGSVAVQVTYYTPNNSHNSSLFQFHSLNIIPGLDELSIQMSSTKIPACFKLEGSKTNRVLIPTKSRHNNHLRN